MKQARYKEPLPLAVIEAARAGDAGAVEQVLQYYNGYINKLCIGVVFTFLGRLQVIDNPVGQRAQTAAVFLGGLPDGCLVTPQVQRDDAAVIHDIHLLPVSIEGPSPI